MTSPARMRRVLITAARRKGKTLGYMGPWRTLHPRAQEGWVLLHALLAEGAFVTRTGDKTRR
jgi:hypothetical protein